jgi:UDP-N-acetylmuramate dehydrogenase
MENNNTLENISENVSLKEYSTFKIGGSARYFCKAKSQSVVESALNFAIEKKLQVFIIGKGSNLLISDNGFSGLVLKIEDNSFGIEKTIHGYDVRLGSGVHLTKLSLDLQKEGISGLEWAAGIPATVGGAVCNNSGAHGKDMSGLVKSVSAMEMKFHSDGKYLEHYRFREMDAADLEFSYRNSIFKKTKNFVILGAVLSLTKGDRVKMQNEISVSLKNRLEKQPLKYPNIGSIFKNPVLTEKEMNIFYQKCPGGREQFKNNTIPAGWLIEQLGLKGKHIGGAMVSEKHANFIVNINKAKAEEVVILISIIKQKVRTKFDIQLREEIEYMGF